MEGWQEVRRGQSWWRLQIAQDCWLTPAPERGGAGAGTQLLFRCPPYWVDWIIPQACVWAWRNVLGKHGNLNDKKRIASQRILILLLPAETRKFRGSKNEIKENVNGNFEPRKGLVWVLKDSLTWLITAPKYYCYDLQALYVFVTCLTYIIFSLLLSNS